MAQRTGRRVSSSDASLPAHGKRAQQANAMQPGVPQDSKLGDGSSTDYSASNDKPGKAKAPKACEHKGPSRD